MLKMPMSACIPQQNKLSEGINIFYHCLWEAIMQLGCKSNPYNVKVMSQDEFLSFTTRLGTVFSNIINKKFADLGGKCVTVKWSKLCQVCLPKPTKHKLIMLYKYDLTTPFRVVVIQSMKKPSIQISLSTVSDIDLAIPKPYKGRLPVELLLKKDLLGLCSSNAILPNYHEHYHNLSTGNLIGDDSDNINSDLDQDIADSDNE